MAQRKKIGTHKDPFYEAESRLSSELDILDNYERRLAPVSLRCCWLSGEEAELSSREGMGADENDGEAMYGRVLGKVALETIRGELTPAKLAAKHGIPRR